MKFLEFDLLQKYFSPQTWSDWHPVFCAVAGLVMLVFGGALAWCGGAAFVSIFTRSADTPAEPPGKADTTAIDGDTPPAPGNKTHPPISLIEDSIFPISHDVIKPGDPLSLADAHYSLEGGGDSRGSYYADLARKNTTPYDRCGIGVFHRHWPDRGSELVGALSFPLTDGDRAITSNHVRKIAGSSNRLVYHKYFELWKAGEFFALIRDNQYIISHSWAPLLIDPAALLQNGENRGLLHQLKGQRLLYTVRHPTRITPQPTGTAKLNQGAEGEPGCKGDEYLLATEIKTSDGVNIELREYMPTHGCAELQFEGILDIANVEGVDKLILRDASCLYPASTGVRCTGRTS
ncbi:hypothetical protein [Botrimarina sp.]|uniref:hypothetical protein n=1 Tax=Botrimarina sp. TaxID=2795802 RepID=UPI0032EC0C8A